MARRSGFSHKGVEEKRRSLPIYQHYTLSPGKTKSHHPEAKCNHCLKEFVCGSKQRLIRHLRKCNSIQNPEQIIAETLNTLARNSATGTLNHSILEASNLLPSQLAHTAHLQQQQQQQHNQQTHLIGHSYPALQHHSPNSTAVSVTNSSNNNNNNNNNNIITTNNVATTNHHLPHHISSSNNNNNNNINDPSLIAGSSNGPSTLQPITPAMISAASSVQGVKRSQRRGRKPAHHSQLAPGALLSGPAIHVTTGLDGKAHFSPASQMATPNMLASVSATSPATPIGVASPRIAQVHNGRGPHVSYAYTTATIQQQAPGPTLVVSHNNHQQQLANNTGSPHHLAPQITHQLHHHSPSSYNNKLSSDHIDKSYLKLVLTRNLPLSLCDTKEFQLWVKTLANDYKPPTSINLIAQNLRNEAQVARHRISNIFVKAPKKTINLELHNWSDSIRGRVWYAVIANIDLKRFLISIKDVHQQLQHQSANPNQDTSHTSESTGGQLTYQSSSSSSPINNTDDATLLDKTLSSFINDCIKRVGSDRINSLLFSCSSRSDPLVLKVRDSLYTTNPSIVTYHCWWHFTNLLCADIVEQDPTFEQILRNSNRLINFISRRSSLAKNLNKFNPFAEVSSHLGFKKNDKRWYSHLVCYLLDYIKNNYEAISRALNGFTTTTTTTSSSSSSKPTQHSLSSSSDNNNNSSSDTSDGVAKLDQMPQTQPPRHQAGDVQQNISSSTQQDQTQFLHRKDLQLERIKSIFNSTDYWTNLNLALSYLKPIRDLVALTSTVSNINHTTTFNHATTELAIHSTTPVLSPTIANGLLLTDYISWFLDYGKTLFNSWQQGHDNFKYDLIGRYLSRFSSSISEFKLAFAAYLLNPKHKCAFMTQTAKNTAIEEILNIASEFMPEESDGHTIFDQWKLYLVREEPYDVVYEENRTPLEWWMSLPCAESIRRVALRILRLKAFTSPKLETLFSQLYFYEDETNASLSDTSFEDVAILRYFYDFEDKIGQNVSHGLMHNHHVTTSSGTSSSYSTNGYHDRTQVGQLHNSHLYESNYSLDGMEISATDSNVQLNDSTSADDNNPSFADVVVEPFLNNHDSQVLSIGQSTMNNSSTNLSLENLPGYDLFLQYIDYNELGVQILEEPIEKKKRKWTAQEILSKCQTTKQNSSANEINNK